MKPQTTLYENQTREKPLIYKEIKKVCIKIGASREYVTKQGFVVIVEHLDTQYIGGVGHVKGLYRISDRGMIVFPLRAIGVKNYIRNN